MLYLDMKNNLNTKKVWTAWGRKGGGEMERREKGNVSARLLWILHSPFRFPFKINESFDDINLILF
jgi:hypothetical protein